MASTSVSSTQKRFKYDVFVSFRGEDTRKRFVDRLCYALQQKGITTYKEYERIEKRRKISDDLIRSIEDSRLYIIVFSKNYASSSWCLDELVKIMECRKTTGQIAFPVFYDVAPSEVRKQSGAFGEAFSKLEKEKAADRWRDALTEAAGLAGREWNTTFEAHNAEFIQELVKRISLKLSVSSIQKRFKYDVFLSFRGDDTRNNFVNRLHSALQRRRITTYKDDETLRKGETPGPHIFKAIGDSKFHIIVFSKNYASSSWCLDELVKIMECHKRNEQTAYPIFYDVEPTEVRHQIGAVGEAFAKHVKKEDAGRWRYALTEAAALAGLDLKTNFDGNEAKLIQKLVQDITQKLLDDDFVGMETPVNVVSSIQKSFKYDVFLSFRPEDTHRNFVGHLYHALQHRGITTYIDDERIKKGETIGPRIFEAIGDSKFHIIVFSKNYADSSWCLDELVMIMECQRNTEHAAYPIFYDVEPTEVRNQRGAVGKAFEQHVEKAAARRWRHALKEAGCLSGWDLKRTVNGDEAEFIQRIVEDISRKLHFINFRVDENIVGMETRVKDVISALEIDYDDVRMIGIKGMGGGGKTTLARAVFYHISILFEGKSFVENVKGSSLKELQKQLISDVLNDPSIDVKNVSDGKNMMKKMMGSRKVLVVLDDVDHIDQLEALAGESNWFKPGSRIIITTRDEQVLAAHRVKYIHHVNLLSEEEAICLFSRYAFGREFPIQGYEELSGKLIHYAAGLPLTIKVLGSFLNGRSDREWEDAIERLKTIPLKEILERLELSYTSLEDDLKEIFLDVACILKGERKDEAIRVLESCGFHAEIGLAVLEKKSLITISNDGRLLLHNHIEELGRYIVRHVNPDEPQRHNRLWIKEEIEDILVNDLGTEATRCIKLAYTELHPAIIMKGLKKMNMLRFLYVSNGYKKWEIDARFGPCLPNALRSVHWAYYPFCFLPKTFGANNLVNLEMGWSNITQLWEGGERKVLKKLRFIDLNYSKLRTFDLGLTPNLERLDLRGCKDFLELHVPLDCPKLKYLNLIGSKLCKLDLRMAPNIMTLDLSRCNDFVELHMPIQCPMLKFLNLSGSKLSNLDLRRAPCLEELNLKDCNDLIELHMPIQCPKLKYLNLGGSKLSDYNLGVTSHLNRLESLKELTLSIKDIKHLPDSICMLKHLKRIELKSCFLLEKLPNDLDGLQCLEKLHLSDCISLHDIPNSICKMKSLKYLHLPYCVLVEKLPGELGRLDCLEELNIEGTGIKHLPQSIFQLEGLCIIWSTGRLESCGFTSLKELSRYTASCYIKNRKALTTGVSSKDDSVTSIVSRH